MQRLLSEEADAKEKWSPQITETVWGRTNDIVTLPNNETYYFFKIPHKVKPVVAIKQCNTMGVVWLNRMVRVLTVVTLSQRSIYPRWRMGH